jgi:hypothetical protein
LKLSAKKSAHLVSTDKEDFRKHLHKLERLRKYRNTTTN